MADQTQRRRPVGRKLGEAAQIFLDMNRLAMEVVSPGGVLLSCSCTGLVSEADFLESMRRAAYQAGKELQILAIRGAGEDHPVYVHVPESRYLKAVFCRVFDR